MNWFLFCLKTSRPGLWFPTIWLYTLPIAGQDVWSVPAFWIGLLYATFPLNFLVYGWNDMVDQETDRLNPRKDTYLFGARGSDSELNRLPKSILIVQLFSWPILLFFGSWQMALVALGIIFFCWIYNAPNWGFRGLPPLELLSQVGYLLVLPLSCLLNQVALPSIDVWFYLFLFCTQSQLIGEVMDIEPDRQAGRDTTATKLGRVGTKILIIGVVLAETLLVWLHFGDSIFGAGLLGFLLWLLLDVFVLYANKAYTMRDFKLLGIGSNIVALLSMIYVWQVPLFV
jgi:4-hydroxybenzoate polyprenyltransferase